MKNLTFNRLLPRYVGNFDIRKLLPGLFGQTLDMSGLSSLILPSNQTITSPNITNGNLTTPIITGAQANGSYNAPVIINTPVAVNSTATLTAAQVASGYITSTSGAAVTMTLPTGTLLGTQLGAVQGTIFDLYIDNTAGSNTVTIAVAVNGILSAAAAAGSGAGAGLLTVPSGATGIGCFRLTFASATAYVFSRIA